MGGDAQPFEQRDGPPPPAPPLIRGGEAWVVALGSGGIAELTHLAPGEPVVEQIGHGQEGLCHVEGWRAADDHRQQLVEAIELHELNAGLLEYLRTRHAVEGHIEQAIGSAVAVVIRIRDQRAVPVEQAEIHPPRVKADARQVSTTLSGGHGHPLFYLCPQTQYIPVHTVWQIHGAIGKTAHL